MAWRITGQFDLGDDEAIWLRGLRSNLTLGNTAQFDLGENRAIWLTGFRG
jgi:hypothetical protein